GGTPPPAPAATDRTGLHRPARRVVRQVQRTPASVEFLCAAGRFAALGAAARGPHRGASGRAIGVGGGRFSTGRGQRAAGKVSEPALGSAVHPGAGGQPRRGRAVETRRPRPPPGLDESQSVAMKHNRSIPPVTVIPVLVYPDVRAAVDWLTTAFGFVERTRIGESHRAQLSIGTNGAMIVAGVARERNPPQANVVAH